MNEENHRSSAHGASQQRWNFPKLMVSLPAWVESVIPPLGHVYRSDIEKMELVLRLAHLNIMEGSGGPFGAAVFDMRSQRLLAPGVNLVLSSKWSGAHAEMIAIALAQSLVESHDLAASASLRCELFSSTEPCAMCLGAIPWSGIRRLVCGARDQDARCVGFDEGAKPQAWSALLRDQGIEVRQDVLREEAVGILREYIALGRQVYNSKINAPGAPGA
ncbi:MAG: nucleoside deaminase [Kiritimatiellaeota bacterium]|nr:nucleoside deaminase [Kiritimatiellota bacterium]